MPSGLTPAQAVGKQISGTACAGNPRCVPLAHPEVVVPRGDQHSSGSAGVDVRTHAGDGVAVAVQREGDLLLPEVPHLDGVVNAACVHLWVSHHCIVSNFPVRPERVLFYKRRCGHQQGCPSCRLPDRRRPQRPPRRPGTFQAMSAPIASPAYPTPARLMARW